MSIIVATLARRLATAVMAIALLAGPQIAQATESNAIARVDPVAGALAYAPQTQALYKTDGQALYRSNNGGRQWTKVPVASSADDGRIAAVAVSAAEQSTIYVAGPGVGVLKSADAGNSWLPIDQGLPSRDIIALATHSTSAETLYAVVAQQGIYRSEDGGARWRMVDKGPDAPIRQLIHSDLEGSMQTGWLFAATDKGVYRGMDCFCGWRIAGNLPAMVSAVAYDPKQPKELYAAAGRQVFTTGNGGEEWQPAGSPGGEVSALAHSASGVLYALLADGRVVQSRNKGRQWE